MKSELLSVNGSEVETVHAFGMKVTWRPLTGNERDEYDCYLSKKREENDGVVRGARAQLVAMGLCEPNGDRCGFTEAEVEQLGNKNGRELDRLFEVIRTASGIGYDEEAEKNLQSDQSENSG